MTYFVNSSVIGLLILILSQRIAIPFQTAPDELKSRIDPLVAQAYEGATAAFPCQLKSRGKPRMAPWHDVDRCLNGAAEHVDWPKLAGELGKIRSETPGLGASEFWAAVDSSLSARALTYER